MPSVAVDRDSLSADTAIKPTAAALRPDRIEIAIGGSDAGIWFAAMPMASMPMAPGSDHRRKARKAGRTPCWTSAMPNASLVEAGPGSALPRAKRSLTAAQRCCRGSERT